MKPELLIEELTPTEGQIVQEAMSDGKSYWLSGIYMQSNIKNRNGRNYPLSEISRVVESAQRTIKEHNGIFGELDHPQSLTINLDRVSHVITELRMDGNNAVGRAKIINTPMGEIAKALIESGVRFGVSSRGAGQVNSTGDVSGFNFITVDIVATPSAPEAMPESIYESLMNDVHGYKAVSLAEQIRNDAAAQEYLKREIVKFVNNCWNRK